MIDRIVQLYEAFMAMPIEGQVITGAGALVAIVAARSVWKLTLPVRWTVASALRVCAWIMHPRKRNNGGVESVIPFDISSKKNTKATYTFYSQSETANLLTDNQINLLDAARIKFEIVGNGGLGEERARRKNGTSTASGATATVVPFDFTTEERAQAAYDYYAGTDVVQTLSEGQMNLISDAIATFGLKKNNGLTQEGQRRKMQQKQMELQHPHAFVVDAMPEPEVVVQKSQVTMENVA